MQTARTVSSIAAANVLAVLMMSSGANACSVGFKMPGPMPTDFKNLQLSDITTSTSGMMVQSYFETNKIPFVLGVNAKPGTKSLYFAFSKTVTHIRIISGMALIYEGRPVQIVTDAVVPSPDLRVEFEWEGEGVSVAVSGFC